MRPASKLQGFVCACALLGAVQAASTHNSSVEVLVDCCTVVKTLYKYMAVDDQYLPCTTGDVQCPSLRLVQLFMQHTSTTLNPLRPALVRGSDIVFFMPTDSGLTPLLVFAFFGRSVSPADEEDMDMWLSYDTKLNKIRFEDSTCDFDRNVYTTLVLSTLALLMFFIAVSLVTDTDKPVEVAEVLTPSARSEQPDKGVASSAACSSLLFRRVALPPTLRFVSPFGDRVAGLRHLEKKRSRMIPSGSRTLETGDVFISWSKHFFKMHARQR
jgi:hypothetical protein